MIKMKTRSCIGCIIAIFRWHPPPLTSDCVLLNKLKQSDLITYNASTNELNYKGFLKK